MRLFRKPLYPLLVGETKARLQNATHLSELNNREGTGATAPDSQPAREWDWQINSPLPPPKDPVRWVLILFNGTSRNGTADRDQSMGIPESS